MVSRLALRRLWRPVSPALEIIAGGRYDFFALAYQLFDIEIICPFFNLVECFVSRDTELREPFLRGISNASPGLPHSLSDLVHSRPISPSFVSATS